MEALVAIIVAQVLDPVRIVLIGVIVWGSYKLFANKLARWGAIGAGSLVVAVLIAAMLNRPTVIPGFISGLIIAGIIAAIVRAIVRWRVAP